MGVLIGRAEGEVSPADRGFVFVADVSADYAGQQFAPLHQ